MFSRAKIKYYLPAIVTAIVGLIISSLAAYFQYQTNTDRVHRELANTSSAIIKQTAERMELYSTHMYGMRSAAIAMGLENVGQSFVNNYINDADLKSRFPGIQAIGIARRVTPSQENSFLAQIRAGGNSKFKIRQFAPNYQSRYIIQFVEPPNQENFDFGTDLASDESFQLAATLAAQTGQSIITPPITWDGKNNNLSRSSIIFLPIYYPGASLKNSTERFNSVWGWVCAYVSLGNIFENEKFTTGEAGVSIADTVPKKSIFIYKNNIDPSEADEKPVINIIDKSILGRNWVFTIEENKNFIGKLNLMQPWLIFLIFITITILTTLKIVDHKKRLLASHISSEQNAILAAIVENSADAIIGESLSGKVISWNNAAQKLFNYTEAEALGAELQDLIFFESKPFAGRMRVQQAVEDAGASVSSSRDTVLKHRAGHPIDVHLSIGLLKNKKDEVTGIANLIQDIRERKKAERSLQEMHQQLEHRVEMRTVELDKARNDLQTVLDAVPSMIGYWDRNLNNKIANKAYTSWYYNAGADHLSSGGERVQTLWAANEEPIRNVLLGKPQQFEKLIKRPDSDIKKHTMVNLLPDMVGGKTVGFYAVLHDIDDAVKARISLLAERERLNNIIEGTHVGTWEWNIQTGEMHINEQWAATLGYELSELTPTTINTWTDRIHPDDTAQSAELLQSHFVEERGHYSCESRMRHKRGHWVWIQTRGRILSHTEGGAPEWMYGTQQDITTHKNNELEMARIAGLLRSILQAATQMAIIATDRDGTMTVFNSGAEHLLGYKPEDLVGVTAPTMLLLQEELQVRREELRKEYRQNVEGFDVLTMQANRTGAEEREWTFVRKDTSLVPVKLTVTTIHSESGDTIGYLAIAQDISQRRQIEATLLKAKASAEANSRAKSMFLANMSHEIRTPMNAVIGVSHLLESSNLDDQQRRLLSKLQIAGRSLLGIINDVLDLAKIEAGELQVENIPFSPRNIVKDVLTLFEVQAQAKGLALESFVSDDISDMLLGDSNRLRQILTNLVSNAIKFTERGSVSIHALATRQDNGTLLINWHIKDTGAGISEEVLSRLFTPFNQADASTTRRYGGTGLGLSIVRQLAQLMGGDAYVTSQLGVGSVFGAKIPFTQVQSVAQPVARELSNAPSMRVFVVDDAEDSRQALAAACHSLGWQTRIMCSSEDLIEEIHRCAREKIDLPDAMLVDWQMPGIDGLAAILQLAGEFAPEQLPTALIVSAHSRDEINALDHNHMVDEILVKPVNATDLFNAVNKGVAKRTGKTQWVDQVDNTNFVEGKALENIHILVVDDSDINLEIARLLLEREGATVQTAVNGLEALTVLQKTHTAFDAVLMDVQMPVMDGYEASRRIRAELGLGQLPVLALTAGALNEERQRAEAAGMNGFLTKPLDPRLMVQTLRQAIANSGKQPLVAAPTSPSPHADASAKWPRIAGVHSGTASKQLGGDSQLFLRLLNRMLHEFSGDFEATSTPPSEADLPSLIARMHKLRGSAGNLGVKDIHLLAGDIEQSLRSKSSWESVLPKMTRLNQSLHALVAAAAPFFAEQEAKTKTQTQLAGSGDAGVQNTASPEDIAAAVAKLAPLYSLLEQQDMEAMMELERVSEHVLVCGGAELATQLQAAVDLLDFAAAHKLLAQKLKQVG